MTAAEIVEGQIAEVIVEAVKETSFLPAMDWKIRRVQIQHDLFGRFPVCFYKHIDQ